MKKYFLLILLCAVSIITIPVGLIEKDTVNFSEEKNNNKPTAAKTTAVAEATTKNEKKEETIAVFLSDKNTTVNVSGFEYICGSVAAEMPLAYEEEAIKAQAIACYTNALRLKKNNEAEKGDISDDTAVHQGYISKTERKEKWGEDFPFYEEKLQNAVKKIYGKALYYEDNLCVASFSAISNGKTENAENLWGFKIPYLISVDSSGDKLSPKYPSSVTYTEKEFISLCKKSEISADSVKDIKVTKRSETGMVLKINIGNKELTGQEAREIFKLRSPTFSVKTDKNTVTFTVKGYGHGVGLSQNGANYLAQQGYTYEEILKHYYTDVTIK